jgi:hypothetical protein
MRSLLPRAALALAASSSLSLAQTPVPAPYAPLLFNPYANHWVFRTEGTPWLCVQDGRCTRLRFERIADADLPFAVIASLGFADRVFYLAVQHPRYQDGRPRVFRCTADGCSRFELEPGEFTHLGSFAVKQRDRVAAKTAILARHDNEPARTRLLWCADSGCSELALTRENRLDLAFLGAARFDGRERIWLREGSGAVLSCAQPEAEADRLDCERTSLAYPEFPGADPGELDQRALAAAIDDALKRGNLGEAERLLAEAQGRFPGQPQWAPFAQRLAQLRAERDTRLRTEQARRLVADARRYAQAGDFPGADNMLQQAARLAPNLPELAQARAEIARLRAERERRFRERGEYVAAIERALGAFRLWEAESLIAEAQRRFANDPAFRNYRARLERMRAEAQWQRRLGRARGHIAAARQAIERGDFGQAERQLDEAEEVAPGLPEIREARAELQRERIDAEWRADEIRQLVAAIEAALTRNRLIVAERLLADAQRRYPRHAGWSGLQRRLDQAKRVPDTGGPDRERLAKARDLVAKARRAATEGKFAEAERDLQEAHSLAPNLPELAAARSEVAKLKREAEEKGALRKHLADARAALQRKDLAAAERALAEAEKLDRDAPEVKAIRADFDKAKRDAAADREQSDRIQKLLADARAALQRKDLAAAERALAEAEKLDRDAAPVKAVRADLDKAKRDAAGDREKVDRIQKLVAEARAALLKKDLAAAERAVVEAEKLDKEAPPVKAARAELDKAKRDAAGDREKAERLQKLVAEARAALQRKDLAAAERLVAEAEKLDKDAAPVKAVRADLEAAKKTAQPQQPRFDEAKLRAAFHDRIMAQIGPQAVSYRAMPGNKALAYCIDWSKVRADAVPPGPFVIESAPESDTAPQRALTACRQRGAPLCTCTLVDVNGRNALRVPAEVVERLNKTP